MNQEPEQEPRGNKKCHCKWGFPRDTPGRYGVLSPAVSSIPVVTPDTLFLFHFLVPKRLQIRCEYCPRFYKNRFDLLFHMREKHGIYPGKMNIDEYEQRYWDKKDFEKASFTFTSSDSNRWASCACRKRRSWQPLSKKMTTKFMISLICIRVLSV